MKSDKPRPELQITVFSDYICPFCYIGSERLQRLKNDYVLKVNWMFIEIHPETPPTGMPIEQLNYSPEHWQQLMGELMIMAQQDGIHIAERSFTTNSHSALLLAEAVKRSQPEKFNSLHDRLFTAFFGERQNIADVDVLTTLALECGLDQAFVFAALSNDEYESALQQYSQLAMKHRIRGVPTYIIGNHIIFGASAYEDLKQAADQVVNNSNKGANTDE